jgi:hypothetical protein
LWCTVPLSYKRQNVINNTFIDYFSPVSNFRYVSFFILIFSCLKYLFVYQNAAPAKLWGLIITTKLTRIVTEHLSTSARMDAFTKGNPSYLCGTLGPIVLLHYIKDFWTAEKIAYILKYFLHKWGVGALYQTMLLFLYSSLGNRTSKSQHLCVGDNKNTDNREANHVDLLQLWI